MATKKKTTVPKTVKSVEKTNESPVTVEEIIAEKGIEALEPEQIEKLEKQSDEFPPLKVAVIGESKLTVVFPYYHAMAQGDELLYALRSLHANLREDFQVVIIGDKLPWFSPEVICIETERTSENPQIDTLYKLQLAIAADCVSDSFIWMNDDIYTISPTMLADIQGLTAYGKLLLIPGSKKVYDINRNKTVEVLKKLGLSTHNYDTHTPFYFEKEKLVQLFEIIPELDSEGLLIPSIYYNFHFKGYIPRQIDNIHGDYMLRLISKNTAPTVFNKYVAGKKFLNNSEMGYNSVLLNFLKAKFPTKSRFEK